MTPVAELTVVIAKQKIPATMILKGSKYTPPEGKMPTPNSADFWDKNKTDGKRVFIEVDPNSDDENVFKRQKTNNENVPCNGQTDLTCATVERPSASQRNLGKKPVLRSRASATPLVPHNIPVFNTTNTFSIDFTSELSNSKGFSGIFGQCERVAGSISSAEFSAAATPTKSYSSQSQELDNKALTDSLNLVINNGQNSNSIFNSDDELRNVFESTNCVDLKTVFTITQILKSEEEVIITNRSARLKKPCFRGLMICDANLCLVLSDLIPT